MLVVAVVVVIAPVVMLGQVVEAEASGMAITTSPKPMAMTILVVAVVDVVMVVLLVSLVLE
jgi:hypothetical protein